MLKDGGAFLGAGGWAAHVLMQHTVMEPGPEFTFSRLLHMGSLKILSFSKKHQLPYLSSDG